MALCLNLVLGERAGTLDIDFLWVVEQKAVAHGCDGCVCDGDAGMGGEEGWGVAFCPQSVGVVVEVVVPSFELSGSGKDAVVVSFLPEAVEFFSGLRSGVEGVVASFFEAEDDAPQVAVHRACDVDDAVDVVGHGLEGEELDLGVEFGDVVPCLFDLLT